MPRSPETSHAALRPPLTAWCTVTLGSGLGRTASLVLHFRQRTSSTPLTSEPLLSLLILARRLLSRVACPYRGQTCGDGVGVHRTVVATHATRFAPFRIFLANLPLNRTSTADATPRERARTSTPSSKFIDPICRTLGGRALYRKGMGEGGGGVGATNRCCVWG